MKIEISLEDWAVLSRCVFVAQHVMAAECEGGFRSAQVQEIDEMRKRLYVAAAIAQQEPAEEDVPERPRLLVLGD